MTHVDNEDKNACCLWVPNRRGSTVPHRVVKTQWTDRVCKEDPVLDSAGFIIQGSGVIYRSGRCYRYILACETNTGTTKRLISIFVITVIIKRKLILEIMKKKVNIY